MEDDWELLHNSDDSAVVNSVQNTKGFEGIEGAFSNGLIRSDYFSLDAQNEYQGGYVTEEGSVESDNPSWIDPESVIRFPVKESAEFWSDSSSDRSDDHRKFGEFDAKSQFVSVENDEIIQASLDGIGEIGTETENLGTLSSDNENSRDESELSVEEKESDEVENVAIEAKSKSAGVEEEKRSVVWWKLPLELLKYCVFRASPVWSISVAAAVMGFVILGRRLYKMKKKSRSLPLKVTLDDKKVSQFMNRAARLNEAFSVVRRVPVIRPSLPAAGVTPWPMMSLR